MADKIEHNGAEKNGEPTTLPSDVFKVQARMPPFWPDEPEIWFSQLEGQFAIAGITNDTMKFYHVTSQLDRQFLKRVEDVIICPPAKYKYIKLKSELIKRLSDFNEKKAHQIIMHEEQGDRKPSHLLRHLQSLAGGDKGTEEFLRTIWTRSLPEHIQTVVAAQPTASLDVLADLADKIHDIVQPAANVSAVCKETGSTLDSMAKEIAELRKQVEALTTQENRKSGSSPRNQSTPHGQTSELGGQTGAVLHFNLNTDPWGGLQLNQQPGYPYGLPHVLPAPAPGAYPYVPAPMMMHAGMPVYPPAPQPQPPPPYVPQLTPAPPSMTMSYDPVEWVPTSRATASTWALRALVAGKEGSEGSPLWVIRAYHGGEFMPGKLAIKRQAAYVPYDGDEVPVYKFELLCVPEHLVKWVPAKNGAVPSNAIKAGNSRFAEPLYVCRAKHLNFITPGKVHPSQGCAFISFGGKEIRFLTYQVLCKKTQGELTLFPEI